MTKTTQIHFILGRKLFIKKFTNMVPLVGDEIRIGGEGKEKYYKVVRRVWAFDEPECPFDRVNIGIKKAKEAK